MIIKDSNVILKQFDKPYKQLGKHRKCCPGCNKLILDGELATFTLVQTEKWYPVKGLMTFNNWKTKHTNC